MQLYSKTFRLLNYGLALCILCLSFTSLAQYTDTLRISDEDGFVVIGAAAYIVDQTGQVDSSSIQLVLSMEKYTSKMFPFLPL